MTAATTVDTWRGQPSAAETFPQLLLEKAETLGTRVAMREKHRGIWRTWTWPQVATETRALATGLAALGFSRGDRLVVIGQNRPRLYWAMCAVQMLGGVAMPIAADTPIDQLKQAIAAGGVRFAVAEGQEQCDKLLEARGDRPVLSCILFDNPRGLQDHDDPSLHAMDGILEKGRAVDRDAPIALVKEIAAGRGSDLAVILARPGPFLDDGVVGETGQLWHSHIQGMIAASARLNDYAFGCGDELLAHLPMGSWNDYHFSYALALVGGLTVNFPESADAVPIDIREVGPTVHVVQRQSLVDLMSQILSRMRDASVVQRTFFNFFRGYGIRTGAAQSAPRDRGVGRGGFIELIGDLLYFSPLRDVMGISRLKVLFVDGVSAQDDALLFFGSIGVNVVRLQNAKLQGTEPAKPERLIE